MHRWPDSEFPRQGRNDHNVEKFWQPFQNPDGIYDLGATSGCPPRSKDKDSISFSWPSLSDVIPSPIQDAFSSPIQTQSAVRCDKYEYETDCDITGLSYLTPSLGDSTATCSSSPAPKKKLCYKEDQPLSNMLPEAVSEDAHGTFPPSSSPLQCSSPVEIMSSPVGSVGEVKVKASLSTTNVGRPHPSTKDERELTCLQRSVELCREGHVRRICFDEILFPRFTGNRHGR